MADEGKTDPKIEYAKLAERAERYEDMAKVHTYTLPTMHMYASFH